MILFTKHFLIDKLVATYICLICSSSDHTFFSYSSHVFESQLCVVTILRSLVSWSWPTHTAMKYWMLLTWHSNGSLSPSSSFLNLELKTLCFVCCVFLAIIFVGVWTMLCWANVSILDAFVRLFVPYGGVSSFIMQTPNQHTNIFKLKNLFRIDHLLGVELGLAQIPCNSGLTHICLTLWKIWWKFGSVTILTFFSHELSLDDVFESPSESQVENIFVLLFQLFLFLR